MLRLTWKRTLGSLAALLCLSALVAPAAAQACSCVLGNDLADRLVRGAPALVGEVIAKQTVGEPPASGEPVLDQKVAYTVRVERAFNVGLGAEATIVAGTNGGMCGFTWTVGQRVGAFVGSDGAGTWTTGLCSLAAPDALIAAAAPPPPPPVPRPEPGPSAPPAPPTGDVGTRAPAPPAPVPLPVVKVRSGTHVAVGGARAGRAIDRLPVAGGARIRLRLDDPARSVRFAFARADGRRVSAMRSASAVAGTGREAWTARLPGVLPRGADRLLVAVEYAAGEHRVVVAVGLAHPAVASAAGLRPCPPVVA